MRPHLSVLSRLHACRTLGTALLVVCGLFAGFSQAQTAVTLMPVPKPQYFTQTGLPLAFGCVFTYAQGTTNPLATYTDVTGTTQNQNPVVLSAGGTASIWIQAGVSYRIVVISSGGVNCASGSTLYTVDGVGGGAATLTTIVPYSATPVFTDAAQNQLFKITLTGNASSQPLTAVGVIPPGLITWEIAQDGSGGHTFTWPSNSVGGCTIGSAGSQVTLQHFIWDGTTAIATGPCVIGNGPTISTGNILDYGLGASSAVFTDTNKQLTTTPPGGAGSVTYNAQGVALGGSGNVNSGAAAHSVALNEGNGAAIAGLALGANQFPVGAAGADPVASTLPTCPSGQSLTFSGTLPLTCSGKSDLSHHTVVMGGNIVLTANVASTILTQAVTMPTVGCPCRALVHAQVGLLANVNGTAFNAWITDGTSGWGSTQVYSDDGARTPGIGVSAFSENTYANSANITFTLKIQDTVGSTVSAAFSSGAPQNSWMSVDIVTSN